MNAAPENWCTTTRLAVPAQPGLGWPFFDVAFTIVTGDSGVVTSPLIGTAATAACTVQLADAEALTLPAASVARTVKVCVVSARPEYDFGLVQALAGAASSEQANATAPDSASVKAN